MIYLFVAVHRIARSQNAHPKTKPSTNLISTRFDSTLPATRISKMNSDQYIVTVFSFKKSKNSHHPSIPNNIKGSMATSSMEHSKASTTTVQTVQDMDHSFNSSVSTNYGPPLDYSFRNISSLEKLERHRPPRQSLRKQVSFYFPLCLVYGNIIRYITMNNAFIIHAYFIKVVVVA